MALTKDGSDIDDDTRSWLHLEHNTHNKYQEYQNILIQQHELLQPPGIVVKGII